MTFPVKFKPTNLQQKKPSICSTYLMYFLYKKTPFRVCSFGGLPRTCLPTRESIPVHCTKKHPFGCVLLVDSPERVCQRENPPRPLHKKTPFRVCSFGGLPRTCLSTRESSPSTTQKNTLSGVFFWWTGMDSNHRRQCRQIYSLIPLAAREPVLELVIGVEPTTC